MKVTAKEDCGKYRVFFNGVDITRDCFEADDIKGEVGVFLRNEAGTFYYDEAIDDAAQEYRSGEVKIIPRH